MHKHHALLNLTLFSCWMDKSARLLNNENELETLEMSQMINARMLRQF